APVPSRFAREVRAAAFIAAGGFFAGALFDVTDVAVVAFASAMTAFVSGDVSRVAALANVLSPAALVRLPDRGSRRSAGEAVSDGGLSGGHLFHAPPESRPPGPRP